MIGIVMDVSRDEFYRAIQDVREDIAGVNMRLDTLNGRTRNAEQDIAVLKDRGARQALGAGGAGAGAGLVLAMVWEWFKARL